MENINAKIQEDLKEYVDTYDATETEKYNKVTIVPEDQSRVIKETQELRGNDIHKVVNISPHTAIYGGSEQVIVEVGGEIKIVSFEVPPKTENNHVIKLSGEVESSSNAKTIGDLFLKVNISEFLKYQKVIKKSSAEEQKQANAIERYDLARARRENIDIERLLKIPKNVIEVLKISSSKSKTGESINASAPIVTKCKCLGRVGDKCEYCGGNWKINFKRKVTIELPPNVESGHKFVFEGQGLPKTGVGPSGDLIFEVKVVKNNNWIYATLAMIALVLIAR